jgi:hypothetical protein
MPLGPVVCALQATSESHQSYRQTARRPRYTHPRPQREQLADERAHFAQSLTRFVGNLAGHPLDQRVQLLAFVSAYGFGFLSFRSGGSAASVSSVSCSALSAL